MDSTKDKVSVCVVGAGVTGLVSALLLARDGRYHVTLLEKEPRLGGHALTVPAGKDSVPVDLGFQVYNEINYPLLCRLFDELEIETEDSEMSFSSSTPTSEWASHGLNALFATRSNLVSPKFLRMVREMFRFGKEGTSTYNLSLFSTTVLTGTL
jgi:predicted NAD/FAD-binding protein